MIRRRDALRAAGRNLVHAWPHVLHLAMVIGETLRIHLLDALAPRAALLRPLCHLFGHWWRPWDCGPQITCYTCGKVIHEDDLAA